MSEVPDVLPAADKLEVLKNPSANSWDPFNVRGMPHSLSHLSATASVRIKRYSFGVNFAIAFIN